MVCRAMRTGRVWQGKASRERWERHENRTKNLPRSHKKFIAAENVERTRKVLE